MPSLGDIYLDTEGDVEIGKLYSLWKPILFKQIELYNPDIIIFGNTFSCFQNDLFPAGVPEHKSYLFEGNEYVWGLQMEKQTAAQRISSER